MDILRKGLLVILTFCYIYSLPLFFLPFGSRVIFALCAFLNIILLVLKKREKITYLSKTDFTIFTTVTLLAILSLASGTLNQTKDYEFLSFSISIILMALSGYFIATCFRILHKNYSFYTVITYIVSAVLIQNIIGLLMFLYPSINDFFTGLLKYDNSVANVIEATRGLRINGFGCNFFGAGIINSVALLLLSVLISNQKKHSKWSYIYIFTFLLIVIIGSMTSRTTLLGLLLGLIYLLQSGYSYKIWQLLIIVISGTLLILSINTNENLEIAFKFGFEMFENLLQGNGLNTTSTDDMLTMYMLPDNLGTYIIGDGYFENPNYPGTFYKDTDIGFLRLLYYFGITGTICYFLYQYKLHKSAISTNRLNKRMYLYLYVLLIILNLKGFSDFSYILFLLYYSQKRLSPI